MRIGQDDAASSARAVRISATAEGFENNVSAWLRVDPSESNPTPNPVAPTVVSFERDGTSDVQTGELDRPDLLQSLRVTMASMRNEGTEVGFCELIE